MVGVGVGVGTGSGYRLPGGVVGGGGIGGGGTGVGVGYWLPGAGVVGGGAPIGGVVGEVPASTSDLSRVGVVGVLLSLLTASLDACCCAKNSGVLGTFAL